MNKRGALLIPVLLAASSGCGGDDEGVWVAHFPHGEVLAAVAMWDGRAAAFVVGSSAVGSFENYTGWLYGAADGNVVDLENDGVRVVAEVSSDPLVMSLTGRDGEHFDRYYMHKAPHDDSRGLYVADDERCRDGVVVFDDSAFGMNGAWCDQEGNVREVAPLVAPDPSGSFEVPVTVEGDDLHLVRFDPISPDTLAQ